MSLSDAARQRAVAGWTAAIADGDHGILLSALRIFTSAPPSLQNDLLNDPAVRDQLLTRVRHLPTSERQQLEELAQDPTLADALQPWLAERLQTIESSSETQSDRLRLVLAIAAVRQPQRALITSLLGIAERETDPQLRTEWLARLRSQAAELVSVTDHLTHWLEPPPNISLDPELARAAMLLLLAIDASAVQQRVPSLLHSDDAEMVGAVLDHLARQLEIRQPLQSQIVDTLTSLVLTPLDVFTWRKARDLLWRSAPDQALQADAALWANSHLPIPLRADLAEDAPADLDREIAGLPLSTEFAAERDCDRLRLDLAIFERRGRLGQADLADALMANLATESSCSDDLSASLDRVASVPSLTSAALSSAFSAHDLEPPDDRLRTMLSSVGKKAKRLWQALTPALFQAIAEDRWERAAFLAQSGVAPTQLQIEQAGIDPKLTSPDTLQHDGALTVFRLLRPALPDLARALRTLAADSREPPERRRDALWALGAVEDPSAHIELLIELTDDNSALVSSVALEEALRAYQRPGVRPNAPLPSPALLEEAARLMPGDTDATDLLALLAPRSPPHAEAFARALGPALASARCLDLLPASPVSTPVALTLLNIGLSGAGLGDPAAACATMLMDKGTALRRVARSLLGSVALGPTPTGAVLLEEWPRLWDATSTFPRVRAVMASKVRDLAPEVPYSLDSQRVLGLWSQTLSSSFETEGGSVRWEERKRWLVAGVLAVPGVVLLHVIVWLLLVSLYPHWPALQSIVFWNARVRKILGAGYIDAVLLFVPYARRRLFQPFREAMLGEILQPDAVELDRIAYFSDSYVILRGETALAGSQSRSELKITEALAFHRGRALLLGASGLGKSSFLRHSLAQRAGLGKELIVYLPATRCTGGVESAIAERVHGFASELDLLRALVHAGQLFVYIDGYNEVDLTTQEQITSFLSNFPSGNILVASQIPLRGLSRLSTYELRPLTSEQIAAFLTSRSAILPSDAVLSGNRFVTIARRYLETIWALGEADKSAVPFEVISNPMDLTTVALLLSRGQEPNLLALQEQEFAFLQNRYLAAYGTAFRVRAFAEEVCQRRLRDQDDLADISFSREVSALLDAKMARMVAIEIQGQPSRQEILFRHDRFRDFFTHFAFLGDEDTRRREYAGDPRFAGVYAFLAKVLPAGAAAELREYLLMRAVETQDHRVSDDFIKLLAWRQRLHEQDPVWLLEYDLQEARKAEREFAVMDDTRRELEAQMRAIRDCIVAAREQARILVTDRNQPLLELATRQLCVLGARRVEDADSQYGRPLELPNGQRIWLNVVAQRETIRSFHLELMLERLVGVNLPVLLIINGQVDLPPEERRGIVADPAMTRLIQVHVQLIPASVLYAAYRVFRDTQTAPHAFWGQIIPPTPLVAAPAAAGVH